MRVRLRGLAVAITSLLSAIQVVAAAESSFLQADREQPAHTSSTSRTVPTVRSLPGVGVAGSSRAQGQPGASNSLAFVSQPVSQSVRQGRDVTFSAAVTNGESARIQWFFNGAEVLGANNLKLTIRGATSQNEGAYFVRAANAVGEAVSEVAFLNVRVLEASPGRGDMAFHPGTGADAPIFAVDVQPNGKIVIGGIFTNFDGKPRSGVARLEEDGSLDPSFDPQGAVTGHVFALTCLDDGKVLVGGSTRMVAGRVKAYLVRLNADGALDTTFQTPPGPDYPIRAFARQADGKILVARALAYTSQLAACVSRLNSDGSLDAEFEMVPACDGGVYALAVQSDGRIWVAGIFTRVGSYARMGVARLLPNGALDLAFDPGPGLMPTGSRTDYPYIETPFWWLKSLLPLDDGGVLVSGFINTAGEEQRLGIVKFDQYGMVDPGFFFDSSVGSSIYDPVSAMARQSDGRVVLAGNFDSANGEIRDMLARINQDGSLDPTFAAVLSDSSPSANSEAYRLAILPDGGLLAVGNLSYAGGLPRGHVGRVFGGLPAIEPPRFTRSLSVQNASLPRNIATPSYLAGGSLVKPVSALTIPAGQDLVWAAPVVSYESAQYQWHVGGLSVPGATNPVFRMPNVLFSTGEPVQLMVRNSAGVAFSPGVTFEVTPPKLTPGQPDPIFASAIGHGQVLDVQVHADDHILISGAFRWRTPSEGTSTLVARLTPTGDRDLLFNPAWAADGGVVRRLVKVPDGKNLVLYEPTADPPTSNPSRCLRIDPDGSLDATFQAPSFGSGQLYAAAVAVQGRIAVGGLFNEVRGTPCQNLAVFHEDGTLDTLFVAAVEGTVRDLAWQPDGKLVVAGAFQKINGARVENLARLNPDGSLDDTFLDVDSPNDEVTTLVLQPDGKILIGGAFFFVGFEFMPDLARIDTNGIVDLSFSAYLDGRTVLVRRLALDHEGRVLVTGLFDEVDGAARQGIARLRPDGSLDKEFEPGTGLLSPSALGTRIGLQNPSGLGTGHGLALDTNGDVLLVGDFYTVDRMHRSHVARLFGAPPGRPAPVLKAPPLSRTARVGEALTLSYDLQTLAPATYRWTRVLGTNTPVGVGTNRLLKLDAVTADDAGDYVLEVDGQALPPIRVTVNSAATTAGRVDLSSFNGTDIRGLTAAILPLSQGRILAGGEFDVAPGRSARSALVRLRSDGSLDEMVGFETNLLGRVNCLARQDDRWIVVGGSLRLSGQPFCLVRMDETDGVDSAWSPSFSPGGEVRTVWVDDDGGLLVGGRFTEVGGVGRTNLARLTAAGVVSETFHVSLNPNSTVHAVARDSSGAIIVGGEAGIAAGLGLACVARLTPEGMIDTEFDPLPEGGRVHAIAIAPDGRLLLAGEFNPAGTHGRPVLVKLPLPGTRGRADVVAEAFGTSAPQAFTVAQQSDGSIILGGLFRGIYSGSHAFAQRGLARLHPDGSLDSTFDLGSVQVGLGAASQGVRVVVEEMPGSSRTLTSLDLRFNHGSGPVGFGADNEAIRVVAVESTGNLLVGGGFSYLSGQPRGGLARIIGTNVTASALQRPPKLDGQYALRGYGGYELDRITITNIASDPDSPPEDLTFSLDPGYPEGMTIDPKSGLISWIPTEKQGPSTAWIPTEPPAWGTNLITIRVTDRSSPPLSTTRAAVVSVAERNVAPVLRDPLPLDIEEGTIARTVLEAVDDDWPPNSLRYYLGRGAPEGSRLDPHTGAFSWTPREDQAPGRHAIEVRVWDGMATAGGLLVINTTEQNSAPVLDPILDQSVENGSTLQFVASAADMDLPPNRLTFSLSAGAPKGAEIEPASGRFSWTVPSDWPRGDTGVDVLVMDDGIPPLAGQRTVKIRVEPRSDLLLGVHAMPEEILELILAGRVGRTYRFEFSDDLRTWQELTTVTASDATVTVRDSTGGGRPMRFYRVCTVP